MEKKSKKVEENFLTSSIFTFESYSSSCELTQLALNISELPETAIKFNIDKSNPLKFAFGSKVGLVRLNNDGSVAEGNILGKLASIKKDDIDGYCSFFEKNGFLFPISLDKPYTIGIIELQFIIDRLAATLELMSTITDMSRTSYDKIVRMIFYHLFAPIIQLEIRDRKYTYTSGRHKYFDFLEENKEAKREVYLEDTFNNDKFLFQDTVDSFSLDSEFVDSVLNGTPEDEKYENPLFQNVFTAYCSTRENKPKAMLLINDFVFHYLYEVGIIESVDLTDIHYQNGIVKKENFSDKLKSKSVEIAKYIIKEEIDMNLRRVRPTYDISKLEPAWKIDSLLSALYFGLFYMRPKMETYRRCANPKCGEFFLVPVSSRKKKYCSTACMNRNMAARKRARDKLKATQVQ